MKFQIGKVIRSDSYGDTWTEYFMDECDIEGVYSEEHTKTESVRVCVQEVPRAILNEKGEPELVYEKERLLADPAWYYEGKNHREEGNHYIRDKIVRRWFIDFDTLEELREFCENHARSIDFDDDPPTIEVYNG